MASVNRAEIIGYLGRDPEVRSFQNGGKVCNLRVATSEVWKDRNTGERREKTEWHSVAVFTEHCVRFAENYLKKGAFVRIVGKMETRKFQDQSGADRYVTEIAVRGFDGEVMGLDRLPGQGGGQGAGGGQGGGYGGQDQSGGQGSRDPRSSHDIDDEIPF
ncbi:MULTISPECIES: single-stranded DNA-binding protein [unclassified Sulfitobacter]|uniref:single-stranded DNA-binding protein n=1 Tax=unclassified Sulfitobacter TaxID=196795 RepID=UPI0023E1AFF2|nr:MULTISPECIES: single-stranded DNA-binding protein [unclassified Sulfitobacter]MDF3383378.1 single-stranded DNA-binding protein [Sulfitobacter sp. Ks11]MDF3386797.1 single-stranded DNA-binding protein [Sulfitobacter sp. M85]MDF3390216.1 single-stranded DNA-binding protein [Sulfitobacter sp. Ks16]MDF3400853.1 single-stranded DNA-binding protein [Sulfitobacter sp. KE39]MDF3404274.1 single-stranded DNA-binding protein [Sulfitobacter sp. Ks35]